MCSPAAAAPERALIGEREFEVLVRREASRLFGVAFAIVRDSGEAEDALQDAMLRAWRSWSKTTGHPDASPWLTRITVNACLTRRARLRSLGLRTRQLTGRETTVAVTSDPRIEQGLEGLTRRQRAVTLLHYHYGYSLDECADLMRCRPGTARSHLHRALSHLREVLTDD